MSIAHFAHAAPPTFGRDHAAPLRQPLRQQGSGLRSRKASPSSMGKASRSMAEYAPATRPFSVGDSSDDDLPEPMRFSALTRALLEEGVSVIDGSTSSVEAAPNPSPPQEHHYSGLPRRQSPGSDNSAKGYPSGSPPSRRVVRLSSGSAGSATVRKGVPLTHAHSPPAENAASRDVSPQDLITPAARPRNVYIKSSVVPPVPSSGALSSTHYADHEHAAKDSSGIGLPATITRYQPVEGNESMLRHGSISLSRPKYGEESGLQSSIRIKRVGKVTGSFLSGPARRGKRRQSDEDHSPAQDNEDAPSHDLGLDEVRRPSPEPGAAHIAGSQARDFAQADKQDKRFNDGPHVSFATGSPGAADDGDGHLRSNSPVAKRSGLITSSSDSNKSSRECCKLSTKVPLRRTFTTNVLAT